MSRKNDMRRIVDTIAAGAGPSDEFTGAEKPNAQRADAITLIRRTERFSTASVLANGTNNITPTGTSAMFRAPCAGRVLQVHFTASGAVAQDAVNNQQLSIKKSDGTVIATAATAPTANGGTGSLVAGVPVLIPLSATQANQHFAQGDVIGPAIAPNAAGVAMPAGVFQVEFELEGAIDEVGV